MSTPGAPTPPLSSGSGTKKPGIRPPLGSSNVPFRAGQVFASVGGTLVYVYDPLSGGLVRTLDDGTGETYDAGSAFDAAGNFYVTDDTNGEISKYSPDGVLQPLFASGLTNPLSLVFDNSGNLYVGQQTTPYVAVYNAAGVRQADIGPMTTQLYGVDWIDLAPDQCTLYYTTEGTDILRYNKCTNTQLSNFNAVSFPSRDPITGFPVNAFELRILPDGSVLVADSDAVLHLDASGNLLHTYSCSGLPGCGGQLLTLALDPDQTSFWTGDAASGILWRINIATGNILQTISTSAGTLYGLTIGGEVGAAASVPLGDSYTATEAIGGGSASECACLSGSGNGKVVDPVNPMDGDYYESATDLNVPGPGIPLAFTRTYDATGAQAGATSPLGTGWADNLNTNVSLNTMTNVATVTEANGAQVQFNPYSAANAWCNASFNYCPAAHATSPRSSRTGTARGPSPTTSRSL